MARTGKPARRRARGASRNGHVRSNVKDLSAALRETFEALALTHKDVAARVPADLRTIGAWARGESEMRLAVLKCDDEIYGRLIRCLYVGHMRGKR
jgi:hypothetical protein